MSERPGSGKGETMAKTKLSYEDFRKQAQAAGLLASFSDADLRLSMEQPEAGLSILSFKKDYADAATDEARALANAGAEQVRRQYGRYLGGPDGSRYMPLDGDETEDEDYVNQMGGTGTADGASARRQGLPAYYGEADRLWTDHHKQYLREGELAYRNALGEGAANTGGIASTAAVAAAQQAQNYYGAKAADARSALYQQAFENWLAERELGLRETAEQRESGGAQEQQRFESAYCGLCHTLGRRYGTAGRMILNYDLTFLAILLSEGEETDCTRRCIAHPIRGRLCSCGSSAFDLAADISVILTWWQLRDGIADHGFWGGLKYRTAAALLHRAYKKARLLRPTFDADTQRHLGVLSHLEAERGTSLDAPADTFAQLLAGAADEVTDPTKRRVLAQLLYHLGRWIYLIDAADDLKKDVKTGSYNPLPLRYGLPGDTLTDTARQELSQTLDSSIRAMAAAFELWDFGAYGPVIESTVYQGLYAVGTAVLDGTFRKKTQVQRKKGGHPRA